MSENYDYVQKGNRLIDMRMQYSDGRIKTCVGKYEKNTFLADTFGYYPKYRNWIVFVTDENAEEIYKETCGFEEEAVDSLMDMVAYYDILLMKQVMFKYYDDAVDKMIEYLKDEYGYSTSEAKSAIRILAKDKDIFFEFYYFVVNHKYIDDQFCTRLDGCSARQLQKQARLTTLGAFLKMIKLLEGEVTPKQSDDLEF